MAALRSLSSDQPLPFTLTHGTRRRHGWQVRDAFMRMRELGRTTPATAISGECNSESRRGTRSLVVKFLTQQTAPSSREQSLAFNCSLRTASGHETIARGASGDQPDCAA